MSSAGGGRSILVGEKEAFFFFAAHLWRKRGKKGIPVGLTLHLTTLLDSLKALTKSSLKNCLYNYLFSLTALPANNTLDSRVYLFHHCSYNAQHTVGAQEGSLNERCEFVYCEEDWHRGFFYATRSVVTLLTDGEIRFDGKDKGLFLSMLSLKSLWDIQIALWSWKLLEFENDWWLLRRAKNPEKRL